MRDGELYQVLQLAEVLHKSIDEVLQWPKSHIITWLAYFKIKREYVNEH
jgi:hypothetical protein